jgi:hypothetical protein
MEIQTWENFLPQASNKWSIVTNIFVFTNETIFDVTFIRSSIIRVGKWVFPFFFGHIEIISSQKIYLTFIVYIFSAIVTLTEIRKFPFLNPFWLFQFR